MDPEDYNEFKQDTLEQMKEFNQTLTKIMTGNMTLVDELGALQIVCPRFFWNCFLFCRSFTNTQFNLHIIF